MKASKTKWLRRAAACVLLAVAGCAAEPDSVPSDALIVELPATDLERLMAAGELSAERVTRAFLSRIEALDDTGPTLRAVIEVNPEALSIARRLDASLAENGTPAGVLHGLPVLLKANIDTADSMSTSAGSLALADHHATDDATLVRRLREAGAVIIGKANLSEWANFRSTQSISGWSSVGGQTRNPYVLDRNPCGSSSGSAVAVAARLVPLAVGTETSGSIVCPAGINGVVGIKPTVGMIEQDGIIPVAKTFDIAGPMARNVPDAALLLAAMANPEHSLSPRVSRNSGLDDIRIGIIRDYTGAGAYAEIEVAVEQAVATLRELGAEIVDPIRLDIPQSTSSAQLRVMLLEFKTGLEQYLAKTSLDPPRLETLIRFNADHADTVMPYFGQERLLMASATDGEHEPDYTTALERSRDYMSARLSDLFERYGLDALLAPTNGPAWKTDPGDGNRAGVSSARYAAVSGFPSITVPATLIDELPFGISLIGRPLEDAALIGIAAEFERRRGAFPAPRFLASLKTDQPP